MSHFAPALSFIVMGALVRFVFRRFGAPGLLCLWGGAVAFTAVVMISIH